MHYCPGLSPEESKIKVNQVALNSRCLICGSNLSICADNSDNLTARGVFQQGSRVEFETLGAAVAVSPDRVARIRIVDKWVV